MENIQAMIGLLGWEIKYKQSLKLDFEKEELSGKLDSMLNTLFKDERANGFIPSYTKHNPIVRQSASHL